MSTFDTLLDLRTSNNVFLLATECWSPAILRSEPVTPASGIQKKTHCRQLVQSMHAALILFEHPWTFVISIEELYVTEVINRVRVSGSKSASMVENKALQKWFFVKNIDYCTTN